MKNMGYSSASNDRSGPMIVLPVLRRHIPEIIFFAFIFCSFTTPIEDGDFFWHIKTGEWIWNNRAMPSTDPFSFTVAADNPLRPSSGRVQFTLKQYWLGQLALYGIWSAAGAYGIVMLRSFLYLVIVIFLYAWMRRDSKDIAPLAMAFVVGSVLGLFPNERPQLFTFAFMPLLLFVLERIRLRGDISMRGTAALWLFMTVWANVHAGYMVGSAMLIIYCIAYAVTSMRNRVPINARIPAALLGAAAVTAINPVGPLAIREFFSMHPVYSSAIIEAMSPLRAAIEAGRYFPIYWAFLFMAVFTLVWRFRVMPLAHLMTMTAFAMLSLKSLRFMPFLVMTSPLLVPHISLKKEASFSIRASMLAFPILFSFFNSAPILSFSQDRFFPAGASAFIRNSDLPSRRLFNYYDWGGYLIWSLPGHKTFIDGRGLVEEVSDLYEKAVWTGRWSEILSAYSADIVVMPGMSRFSGEIFPLIEALYADEHWALVYRDDISLVFMKSSPSNDEIIRRRRIEKGEVYRHIIEMSSILTEKEPGNWGHWLAKARALHHEGRMGEAIAAYRRVLELKPSEKRARQALKAIDSRPDAQNLP